MMMNEREKTIYKLYSCGLWWVDHDTRMTRVYAWGSYFHFRFELRAVSRAPPNADELRFAQFSSVPVFTASVFSLNIKKHLILIL